MKINYIFTILLTAVLLATVSCSKQAFESVAEVSIEEDDGDRVSLTFTAYAPAQPATKAINPTTGVVSWQVGEVIHITYLYDGEQVIKDHTIVAGDIQDDGSVVFVVDDLDRVDEYYAYYGGNDYVFYYDKNATYEGDSWLVESSETPSGDLSGFAIAKTSRANASFHFKNVFNYVHLSVDDSFIGKYISISGGGENIVGMKKVTFDPSGNIVLAEPSGMDEKITTETIKITSETKDLYFPVYPYITSINVAELAFSEFIDLVENDIPIAATGYFNLGSGENRIIELGDLTYRFERVQNDFKWKMSVYSDRIEMYPQGEYSNLQYSINGSELAEIEFDDYMGCYFIDLSVISTSVGVGQPFELVISALDNIYNVCSAYFNLYRGFPAVTGFHYDGHELLPDGSFLCKFHFDGGVTDMEGYEIYTSGDILLTIFDEYGDECTYSLNIAALGENLKKKVVILSLPSHYFPTQPGAYLFGNNDYQFFRLNLYSEIDGSNIEICSDKYSLADFHADF